MAENFWSSFSDVLRTMLLRRQMQDEFGGYGAIGNLSTVPGGRPMPFMAPPTPSPGQSFTPGNRLADASSGAGINFSPLPMSAGAEASFTPRNPMFDSAMEQPGMSLPGRGTRAMWGSQPDSVQGGAQPWTVGRQSSAEGGATGRDTDAIKRMVLNRIASDESPDYNTIYGGKKFSSFADHPRTKVLITSGPNKGKYSSAAGKYQFIAPTWDAQKAKLGLMSFAPEEQDAAAWDLANVTYKANTGRDLSADAEAGNVQWGALGDQWESLVGAKSGPAGSAQAAASEAAGVSPDGGDTSSPTATGLGWQEVLGALKKANPKAKPEVLGKALLLFEPIMAADSAAQLREMASQNRLDIATMLETGRTDRAAASEAGKKDRFDATQDYRYRALQTRDEEFNRRLDILTTQGKTRESRLQARLLLDQKKALNTMLHQRVMEIS